MPVPDFQSLMLPVLQYYGDNLEHTKQETIDALALKLKLTEAERNDLLPSGVQYRFDNRLGWSITYLIKSGLLNRTARGKYVISNRGLDVLKDKPERISMKYLERFPEYLDFKSFRRDVETKSDDSEISTPQERLESSYSELRDQLSHDLLERVKQCSPAFFERLVVKLLVAMGYGGSIKDAGQRIGRSGDNGIDGTIKEDKLGLDVVNIQAKRWENPVGRPEVQTFAGCLDDNKNKKGVFITTSKFTADAKEFVNRIEKKIILIDGELLTQFMIDYGVGVTEETRYVVNKIDEDFFNDE